MLSLQDIDNLASFASHTTSKSHSYDSNSVWLFAVVVIILFWIFFIRYIRTQTKKELQEKVEDVYFEKLQERYQEIQREQLEKAKKLKLQQKRDAAKKQNRPANMFDRGEGCGPCDQWGNALTYAEQTRFDGERASLLHPADGSEPIPFES